MAGNPNYANISLLLSGDSTFVDSGPIGHVATVNGTVISSTQSQFGGASMYFDGSNDYLSYSSHAAFGFGTGDFNIELWVYIASFSVAFEILEARTSSSATPWTLETTAAGLLNIYDGASRTGGALIAGQFNHLAWSRQSGENKTWVNGALGTSWTNAGDYGSARPLRVGTTIINTAYLNGYVDDLCIIKGVALRTSAFTPPTAPHMGYAGQVSGIVRDSTNALCDRIVRAYDRSTGALVGSTTSNGTTGAYTLNCSTVNEVSVIALDDVAGTTENDLILRTTPA